MTFETLGLSTEILRAVADQGYSEPTPIQQQAIPLILQGRDLLASAQTGTGKTASFTLPLLHRLGSNRRPQRRSSSPRALILTPTRELAAQVGESVQTYGQYLPMRSAIVYGGVKIGPQIQKLRRGVDILIATPGRLLDHLGQGTVTLEQVEMLVLDEGDRMLDMGFLPDIRKILAQLPQQRQTMLFSATFSPAVKKLAADLLTDPVQVEVAPHNTAAETVDQLIHPVDRHRKRELLSHMIGYRNWGQVLVFTRTKHGANRLAEQLAKDGLKTEAIHGNKSQAARSRALAKFKQGAVQVLVATDIAARGLDIDHLPHVVNFELPMVPEDYVHRIGRTGRAGKEGQAISLVSPEEYTLLKGIERLLKRDLPKDVVPGYEPTAPLHSGVEMPSRKRSSNPRYRGNRDQARGVARPTHFSKGDAARTTVPVKHAKVPTPRSGKQIHSA